MILLVTGARGFIGRNLITRIADDQPSWTVLPYDIDAPEGQLAAWAREADVVIHLAGINRPTDPSEFDTGNAGFTEELIGALEAADSAAPVIMTSSIQAGLNNPYGISKRKAERLLEAHSKRTGQKAIIYRLPNVFGKGCRPNYNSAVATFCHNIARDLPITVSNPANELNLVYIDDVVDELIRAAMGKSRGIVEPVYRATLGRIVELLTAFRQERDTRLVPDVGVDFVRKLYATYISALPLDALTYPLTMHADARGSFTEVLRTPDRGQVSVNVSAPGVVKGGHYHHTKHEKFLVVHGRGVIRLRPIDGKSVTEIQVSGDKLEVVVIPPGAVHEIENTGEGELITLMWVSECYDPERPDTYRAEVTI